MKKLILLVLIIILVTTGCVVIEPEAKDSTKPIASIEEEKPTSEPTPTEAKTEEKTGSIKHEVGETIDVDGVKITFVSVEKSYGDRDEDFSAFAPEEGKVFAVCNFLIENNSDDDFNISSFYFEAYEDGFSIDNYIFTSGIGVEDLSGTASPGKKIKGALVYEVSEDFKELELEYQPSVWSKKKAVFLYKNE